MSSCIVPIIIFLVFIYLLCGLKNMLTWIMFYYDETLYVKPNTWYIKQHWWKWLLLWWMKAHWN